MWLMVRLNTGKNTIEEAAELEIVECAKKGLQEREYAAVFNQDTFTNWQQSNLEPDPKSIVFIGHGAHDKWGCYVSQNASQFVSDLVTWSDKAREGFLKSIKTVYVLGCDIGFQVQPIFVTHYDGFIQALADALYQNAATRHIELKAIIEYTYQETRAQVYAHMLFAVSPYGAADKSVFAPATAASVHKDYETVLKFYTEEQWLEYHRIGQEIETCFQDKDLIKKFQQNPRDFENPTESSISLIHINRLLEIHSGRSLPTSKETLFLPCLPQETAAMQEIIDDCARVYNLLEERLATLRAQKIALEEQLFTKPMGPLLEIREKLDPVPRCHVKPRANAVEEIRKANTVEKSRSIAEAIAKLRHKIDERNARQNRYTDTAHLRFFDRHVPEAKRRKTHGKSQQTHNNTKQTSSFR